jgi:hypothetical protein
MRFEEIAKQLSEEEGRYISVHAVRTMYYKAMNKLRAKTDSHAELKELLLSFLDEDKHSDPYVNEIIDSMIKYDDE